MSLVVVDYGMGNVFSVLHAARTLGLDVSLTSDPEQVRTASGVIIPGVGAMPRAMRTIEEYGLREPIAGAAALGVPILGICLGCQLVMRTGTEFEPHDGLGLVPGEVLPLPPSAAPWRIPHVGWRRLQTRTAPEYEAHPFDTVRPGSHMYFVHSYYVAPAPEVAVLSTVRFGSIDFCASFAYKSVFGCQFHPEKSGKEGQLMLQRFGSIVKEYELRRETIG